MDADRELFIQQLVAALSENTTLDGGIPSISSSFQSSPDANDTNSSSESAEEEEKSILEHTGLFLSTAFLPSCSDNARLAKDAYMQLQYDYPQVQDSSIEALAELYRRISTEKSMDQIATKVPITATLLDNVAFLNNQSSSPGPNGTQKTQSSEASGLLAASVLILVFRTCLETPEDAQVEALLSSLMVDKLDQARRSGVDTMQQLMKTDEDEFVEIFAVQEDPDDLSEVYEGHLPEPRSCCVSMWNQETRATSLTASKVDKLQYLALYTFSSSFESVSMEKWEQWCLDDNLVAIMKLLVDQKPFAETGNDKRDVAPITLYGPRGEWTRYLYILRDRILRFPGSSRNTLWRLKELIEFLQRHQSVATAANTSHYLVYRVLAELAMSREFQQATAQRAQQGMALVIQELIPLIAIHQLVTATKCALTHQGKILLEHEHDTLEIRAGDDDGDDELVVVVLQLLHFMLFASSNARTTTDKLHESGMLRTLLMLLPPISDSNKEQHAQSQGKRWFPALLRLLGECALWHAGFAAYIARVPKFVAMFSALQEQLVVEQLLLALAFHQHEVQIQTTLTSLKIDIWKVFTSESLFPRQCESYLDAMKKLQDAVFLLDCLEKAFASLRPAMQKELQCSLQQVYSSFGKSFEYPTFAIADAAHKQQRFDPKTTGDNAHDNENKEKKEKYRGQVKALQFTALRNKLRQSVKIVLTALASDSTMAHIGGRVSSKLD